MKPVRATQSERTGTADEKEMPSKEDKIGPVTDELRDHDFPMPPQEGKSGNEDVTVDQGLPDPETIEAGGKPGTIKGDTQKVGEVGAILDQYEEVPDLSQAG